MKISKKMKKIMAFQAVFMTVAMASMPMAYASTSLQDLAKRFLSTVGEKLENAEESRRAKAKGNVNSLVGIADGEELVFALKKGSLVLSEALFAQKKEGRLYLYFDDFLRAVDFPIDIDLEAKKADGWFVREGNRFSMDLEAQEIIVNEYQIPLEASDYFILEEGFGGLYIEKAVLERAFGVGLDFKVSNLEIRFSSDFALPVEEKLYRQQRKESLIFTKNEAELPEIKQDYKMATMPFVDVQMRNSYQKREGADEAQTNASYSVITASDFLYGGLKTYTSGSDTEKIEQFRFDWTRESQSEDETILGFNKIQMGDVTTPRLNVFRGSGQEFGFRLSNESSFLNKENEKTDVTRFEGDIQPGWDIEIYRNNILVATHTADSTGQYIIEDVPLTFGENNFRLVFYGPQGQVSEREELIIRRNNRFDIGEATYSVSLTNQNEITYRNEDAGYADLPDSGSPNLIGTMDFGLSDEYSMSLGGRILERNKEQLIQVATGLTGYFDSGIYEANLGVEDTGEYAIELSALTNINRQSVRASAEFRSDDFDKTRPDVDNLIHLSDVSVSGEIAPSVNYLATHEYRKFESGNNRQQLGFDVSKKVRKGLFGVGYDYVKSDFSGIDTNTQTVSLNGRYNLGGYFLRGNINYDIEPEPGARSYLVAAHTRLNEKLTGDVQLEHTPSNSRTELRTRLSYTGEYFTLTPDLRVNSDNEIFAFTTLRFGLGADPYSDNLKVHRNGLTSRGGVSARVFLDEDGDGIWDIYERPLQDVKVMGKQIAQFDTTNEHGVAFIPSFNAGQLTDITIDPRTLEDPYYVSLNKGNSIRARSGQVTQMDFPIAISGEIDGSVFFYDRYGQRQPVANMNLFLVNMDGKIVNTALTAYDGFYVMSDIFPGDYHVILDPIVLEQNKLVQIEPKGYHFGASGTVFYDQNFTTYYDDIKPQKMAEINANPKTETKMVLELGRFKSKLMLAVQWLKYKVNYRSLLSGLSTYEGLVENALNEGDIRYPLQLGPIKDIKRAKSICEALSEEGVDCMLRAISTEEDAKERKV